MVLSLQKLWKGLEPFSPSTEALRGLRWWWWWGDVFLSLWFLESSQQSEDGNGAPPHHAPLKDGNACSVCTCERTEALFRWGGSLQQTHSARSFAVTGNKLGVDGDLP